MAPFSIPTTRPSNTAAHGSTGPWCATTTSRRASSGRTTSASWTLANRIDEAPPALGRRVDRFLQHEHIIRRPIQLTKAVRGGQSSLRIVASPTRVRSGPIAALCRSRACGGLAGNRHAGDGARALHERGAAASRRCIGRRRCARVAATSRPSRSRACSSRPITGTRSTWRRCRSTARSPSTPEAIAAAFPELSAPVARAMARAAEAASRSTAREWIVFRTLRPKYEDRAALRDRLVPLVSGRCQRRHGLGPRHARKASGCGSRPTATTGRSGRTSCSSAATRSTPTRSATITAPCSSSGRFAARIPGPVDPAATARAKLVDGAWAGRFAHRFKAFTTPDKTLVDRVKADLAELDQARSPLPGDQGLLLPPTRL